MQWSECIVTYPEMLSIRLHRHMILKCSSVENPVWSVAYPDSAGIGTV
jgi:hypothetical protein